jgi:hypothetical protein
MITTATPWGFYSNRIAGDWRDRPAFAKFAGIAGDKGVLA